MRYTEAKIKEQKTKRNKVLYTQVDAFEEASEESKARHRALYFRSKYESICLFDWFIRWVHQRLNISYVK